MTYEEIISQIKGTLYKGIWSDDQRLSSRHIIKVVQRKRARILKQEQEKKKLRERFALQRIGCMELIEATKYECDCLNLKTCSNVKRTKEKVPSPVKDFLHNVTSIDGSILYSPTSFHEYNEFRRLKPLVGKPRYYVSNQYIYIVDDFDKEFISVEAIFDEPEKFAAITCQPDVTDDCYDPLKTDLAVAPDLVDGIVLLTLEEVAYINRLGSEDQLNNANSDNVDLASLYAANRNSQRSGQVSQNQ